MSKNKKEETIPFKRYIEPNYELYYNFNRLKSYRPHIHFYYLNGGRGIGKSTGVWLDWYEDYKKTQSQFVYIRRYKDEALGSKTVMDTMFTGVTTKGIGIKGCFEFIGDNKRLGYCVCLSSQAKLKSGVDFSKVRYIIYDEYTIKKTATRRYIEDEPTEFLELISTIVRTRKDYYVYLIGNNLDRFNPYHAYLNLPHFTNIYTDTKRGIYAEYCKTRESLLKEEEDTPLYKLTKGTKYGDYHYNNEVLTLAEGKKGKKQYDSELLCRFVYNNTTLNVYTYNGLEIFVEYRQRIIKDNIAFIISENNQPNYFHVKRYRQLDISKYISKCYYNREVTYDSDNAIDVFNMIMEEISY